VANLGARRVSDVDINRQRSTILYLRFQVLQPIAELGDLSECSITHERTTIDQLGAESKIRPVSEVSGYRCERQRIRSAAVVALGTSRHRDSNKRLCGTAQPATRFGYTPVEKLPDQMLTISNGRRPMFGAAVRNSALVVSAFLANSGQRPATYAVGD
jgi:hypothetical protein